MMQQQYPVPPWMFPAVQNAESGGNPNAVSPVGAMGPMQVMPQTAADPGFGVQPAQDNSPQELQRVGNDYLGAMMNRYHGNQQQALQAYNWGPGNVDKLLSGQIQPSQIPAETQAYVPKVMGQQPQILPQAFPPEMQYSQNTLQANDASPQSSKMNLMLEAESRGILPPDKLALLQEARNRGLVSGGQPQFPQSQSYTDRQTQFANQGFGQLGSSFNNLIADHTGDTNYAPLEDIMGMMGGVSNAFLAPVTAGVAGATRPIAKIFAGPDTQKEMTAGNYQKADKTAQDITNLGSVLFPFLGKGKSMPPETGGPWNGGPILNAPAGTMKTMMGDSSGLGGVTSDQMAAQKVIPSAAELRGGSSAMFEDAKNSPAALNPNISNAYADKASGLTPQTEGAKIVFGEPSAAEKVANNIQNLRDRPLTLQETQEIDSRLGQLAEDHFDKVKGDYDSEGTKYLQLQHHLRDTWENATESDVMGGKAAYDKVVQARDLWAAQSRMADIERLEKRASLSENPQSVIKNGAKSMLMNWRGTDEEKAAMEAATKTGVIGGALKLASSKAVDALVGAIAGSMGGPVGTAAGAATGAVIGKGATMAGNKLQSGRLTNVKSAIAQRPAVQSFKAGDQ